MNNNPNTENAVERAQLRRLEIASFAEATTLIVLIFVAVPLKYLAGWDTGVRMMGPLHGLAFLAYIWTVVQTVSGGRWHWHEIARLIIAAFIPFGAYFNLRLLARKVAELNSAGDAT